MESYNAKGVPSAAAFLRFSPLFRHSAARFLTPGGLHLSSVCFPTALFSLGAGCFLLHAAHALFLFPGRSCRSLPPRLFLSEKGGSSVGSHATANAVLSAVKAVFRSSLLISRSAPSRRRKALRIITAHWILPHCIIRGASFYTLNCALRCALRTGTSRRALIASRLRRVCGGRRTRGTSGRIRTYAPLALNGTALRGCPVGGGAFSLGINPAARIKAVVFAFLFRHISPSFPLFSFKKQTLPTVLPIYYFVSQIIK